MLVVYVLLVWTPAKLELELGTFLAANTVYSRSVRSVSVDADVFVVFGGPVMGRNCNDMQNPAEDKKLWAKLTAGATMICKMQTHSASLLGLDRRCLCKADKCNDQIWNDVVVQPVLPVSKGERGGQIMELCNWNSSS